MEYINYKLDQFEGPLDLLLTLIQKHKINIDDIPISLLCEQYMNYIEANLEMGLEVAADFLYMASELMLIKSRMLLPRSPQNQEDPRMSLRDAVLEYQKTKLAAAELSDLFARYSGRMGKDTDDISPDKTYVADHDVALLQSALIRALSEAKGIRDIRREDIFDPIVHQSHVAVRGVMVSLLTLLQESPQPVYLDDYFSASQSRSEMVAKFLSILELMKTQTVSLSAEDDNDGEICVLNRHISLTLVKMPDLEQLAALEDYA